MLAQTVWQRFWQYQFYQNALAGGVAIALLCSVLSVFVVLKRVAFAGQGISHAAFGGAGLALLLELFLPPLRMPILRDAVIAAFCVITALVIGRIARQRRLGEDSAIGICLVAAMALGVSRLVRGPDPERAVQPRRRRLHPLVSRPAVRQHPQHSQRPGVVHVDHRRAAPGRIVLRLQGIRLLCLR
jgi:hypothetical protein